MKQIDRIRSMSAEELAKKIANYKDCMTCIFVEECNQTIEQCKKKHKAWLESEVTDE